MNLEEFIQKTNELLEISQRELVFITRDGEILHVLASYDAYQNPQGKTLAETFDVPLPAGEQNTAAEDALDAELARIRRF